MALFFLDYDLHEGRDYQRLYDELARLDAVHILESLWCFKRINTNCERLREHFLKFIDSDCRVVVSEVADWATYKTLDKPYN
jgi:hypothetical protein